MNYNAYPATTLSLEVTEEAAREKEYRQELAESIVAESIGTVGIYTSLDPSTSDIAVLKQAITNRNPEGSDNAIRSSGGWGDWGERHLMPTSEERSSLLNTPYGKLFEPQTTLHEDREKVTFIEMPDDTVELRYYYAAQSYKDGTGRPGNTLNVGFTLSQDKASELNSALEADPSYIDDIVKAQVLAVGMTKQNWDRYISPRDGFRAIKEDKLAIIHASVTGDLETERFAYADKKAMLPAYEQPAATEDLQPSPDNSVDLNEVWEESYEETLQIMKTYIEGLQAMGQADSVISASLTETMAIAKREMHEAEENEQNDPEDAMRSRAMYIAYCVVADEFDGRQANAVQQAELTQDQRVQVESAQSEVVNALASEALPRFTLGDQVTIGSETMKIIDKYTMQNDAQTAMVIVQDSLGNQKHVKAVSIK